MSFNAEMMKKLISILEIIGITIVLIGCQNNEISKSEYWHNQVAKIKTGDTRSKVEKLLPTCPMSPSSGISMGGFQTIIYRVDEDWEVSVIYDYTGIPRDKDGTALDRASPENLVLAAPILKRSKMPQPIMVDNIKIIEPVN